MIIDMVKLVAFSVCIKTMVERLKNECVKFCVLFANGSHSHHLFRVFYYCCVYFFFCVCILSTFWVNPKYTEHKKKQKLNMIWSARSLLRVKKVNDKFKVTQNTLRRWFYCYTVIHSEFAFNVYYPNW